MPNETRERSLKENLSLLGDASYFFDYRDDTLASSVASKRIVQGIPYFSPVDEYKIAEAARNLNEKIKKPSGFQTIHIGVGGSQNLTYIARAKLDGGILTDINYLQKQMWQKIEALVLESPTRQAFVQNFERELEAGSRFYDGKLKDAIAEAKQAGTSVMWRGFIPSDRESDYPGLVLRRPYERSVEEAIAHELSSEDSWLSNDEDYEYIRSLFQKGKIAAFNLDMLDRPRVEMLAGFLHDQKLHVGSVYISNMLTTHENNRKKGKDPRTKLGFYSQQQPARAEKVFFDNLGKLMAEDTVIIDAAMGRRPLENAREAYDVGLFSLPELKTSYNNRVKALTAQR